MVGRLVGWLAVRLLGWWFTGSLGGSKGTRPRGAVHCWGSCVVMVNLWFCGREQMVAKEGGGGGFGMEPPRSRWLLMPCFCNSHSHCISPHSSRFRRFCFLCVSAAFCFVCVFGYSSKLARVNFYRTIHTHMPLKRTHTHTHAHAQWWAKL